jgi:hypothetical protein
MDPRNWVLLCLQQRHLCPCLFQGRQASVSRRPNFQKAPIFRSRIFRFPFSRQRARQVQMSQRTQGRQMGRQCRGRLGLMATGRAFRFSMRTEKSGSYFSKRIKTFSIKDLPDIRNN